MLEKKKKIIGSIFFFFLLNNFVDSTALMEESLKELPDNMENSKESWFEWCFKHKYEILIISIILVSIGTICLDNSPSQLDKINTIFESIKCITSEELYTYLENMDLTEDTLKAVLKVYNKDIVYIEQIKDPDHFQKLIRKLIWEIRKK